MNLRAVTFLSLFLLALLPAHPLVAQTVTESQSLDDAFQRVEKGVDGLKVLSERVKAAPVSEQGALAFRLDQRSIRLMDDIAKLARQIATLPDEDPERQAMMKRLRADIAGTDASIFRRIARLQERIAANQALADAASEPDVYALQAYGHGLEGLRLGYYAALVNLIESREALGGAADELRRQTDVVLYQYAEKLSGRIELLSATLREIKAKSAADPANTGLQSAANEIRIEQGLETARLQSLLKLMTRLEMDTVMYRSVLLRQSSGVSLRLFDTEAVLTTLEEGWQTSKEAFIENAPNVLFKLVVFVLIIFAFRTLAQLVKRIIKSALGKPSVNFSALLKDILVSASGALVMLLGILVALSQMGISLGPALAGLGVAGFIVGFALQDTLGNFAAGGMILFYRPYDVNDFVEVSGASGLVKKMNLVSTTITTFDNQTLVIPNSKIWGDVIKNVTAQATRRVDMEFGISYSDDIEKTERILKEIVDSHEKVLAEPEANIRLHKLADSSVNFVVRPWTATADYWDVYWDITREVKLRFDREGISIPFPQRDVHFYQQNS
ncbi:mechanosensitive ion channel family protein [Pseudomonadota bacterium]